VETNLLVNGDFPWEYLGIYQKGNWRQSDPIQKDVIEHSRARFLAEIFKKNNPPQWMYTAAWDFKIKDGYTQAVWSAKKQEGSLFYFFGQSVKQDQRTELILDLAVPHLHQALKRLRNQNTNKRPPLSMKEKEVLKWLKQGKGTWDISMILNISERTIKFHIANIMQKLDASNRGHALAIAIEQGLIDIE
jgi:DNA-binding CsgD family transcriptional regulator